jgi:hypothetical protein
MSDEQKIRRKITHQTKRLKREIDVELGSDSDDNSNVELDETPLMEVVEVERELVGGASQSPNFDAETLDYVE